MAESFDLERPDHFTAGAVGPPGQRVFYLQAREAPTLVTVKVEKEQVGALAEYLAALLSNLTPAETRAVETDLLEPLDPVWVAGSLAVGYDEGSDRILIVATEASEDDEDDDEEAEASEEEAPAPPAPEDPTRASARFRITRGQAAAFVERARALVKAGRPLCPICTRPRDPGGHVCSRSNGHVSH
jgi:uncharacterized repeat protein (TIGR03847 family)